MRFATFNLLHGRSLTDDLVDLDRLAAAIRTLDPDVLALQEVDCDQPRSQQADLTSIAADAMGAVAHRFVAALSGTPGATWIAATGDEQPGSASYGIALLSRHPVANWQTVRLPRLPGPIPMWLPGPRRVAVVNEEPRAAVIGTLTTPHGRITVANTHLSFIPGWNRVQLRWLRRNLAPFREPTVLMGDLNMTPPTPVRVTGYHSLGAAPTFPADHPTRQLDHVLVRGGFGEVRCAQAVQLPVSDHRALVVDVDV